MASTSGKAPMGYLVARVGVVIHVYCDPKTPNVPAVLDYADGVMKTKELKRQFPDSTWFVIPVGFYA